MATLVGTRRAQRIRDYLERRFQGFRWFSRRFVRNRLGIMGLALVLIYTVIALAAPLLAPPEPGARNPYMIPRASFRSNPSPPGAEHPFGLTGSQYELYYGVIWGTRTAFTVGIVITGSIVLIGAIFGAFAGFLGGVVDTAMMRIVDIFQSIPALIGAIVLVSFLGKGLWTAMMALIVFGWVFYARLMRGEVLRNREQYYVEAARAAGAGTLRMLFRHVIPNSFAPVLAAATLDFGTQVVAVASLSFLGLGPPEGYADWGQLAAFARDWIVGAGTDATQYWYVIVFPGLALLFFVLGFALLGDALQEIYDPQLRAQGEQR